MEERSCFYIVVHNNVIVLVPGVAGSKLPRRRYCTAGGKGITVARSFFVSLDLGAFSDLSVVLVMCGMLVVQELPHFSDVLSCRQPTVGVESSHYRSTYFSVIDQGV